ncbi:MAG TPA: endonuclease/exonuclease/phosphatase family protein [Myxococcota bacterium]|nr:endonuclease/exonuclease/phosphatase family protein [Myxococcota bacterium]
MKTLYVALTVLTYNVHGLNHWLVSDDPEARMGQISSRLDAYDVALVQESWTYWDALASHATHPVRERGNGPDPGAFFQSGLATFARLPLRAVSRGSLGACAGWLGGANDCFADKGYLRVRLRLAPGMDVDFWNLHLDAGESDADRSAREKQLANLAQRIRTLSGDGPLVVAGDFNSEASNPADAALLSRFVTEVGLRDTGARSDPQGAFAHKEIDYVFVRDGRGIGFEVVRAGEAGEFAAGGKPLSDHPALRARLRVTRVSAP